MTRSDPHRSALGGAILERALSRDGLAQRRGESGFVLSFRTGRVEGQILYSGDDANGAGIPLGLRWRLVYRIEGSLAASERPEAKRRLADVVSAIAEAVERLVRTVATADQLVSAVADPDVQEVELGPDLVHHPERLVPTVAAAYATCIDRLGRPPRVRGLPPCLDLAQRPRLPDRVTGATPPATGVCSGCGARAICVANAGLVSMHREGLSPLVHDSDDRAARASFEALARGLLDEGSDGCDIARSMLGGLLGLGSGSDTPPRSAPPPTPIEFSVKVANHVLSPALRFVQYPPSYDGQGSARLALLADRREAVADLLDRHRFDAAAFRGFMETLISAEGGEVELSVGVDASAATARAQCYAHVATSSPDAQQATLQALLVHCDAPREARRLVRDLVARRRLKVELLCWSPRAGAAPRVKLYFGVEAGGDDTPSGLGVAHLGSLSAHTGKLSLAVLEIDSEGAAWSKRDFPVRTHFQRAPRVVDAFTSGMAEGERSRIDELLGGGAFRPWPTWVSVSLRDRGTRALYFVGR